MERNGITWSIHTGYAESKDRRLCLTVGDLKLSLEIIIITVREEALKTILIKAKIDNPEPCEREVSFLIHNHACDASTGILRKLLEI